MRFASLFSPRLVLSAFVALAGCTVAAHAGTININVVNGGFEQTTYNGYSAQVDHVFTYNNTTYSQHVAGWTNNTYDGKNPGYNFVMSGTSTTNSNGAYGYAYGDSGIVSLWGVENGKSNGIGPSPAGGNFLAMDGVYEPSTISQVLTGLTVGLNTQVSFWYAGAEQSNRTGVNSEGFTVTLGNQSQTTAMLQNDSQGFTGWQYATLNFTATSATETLSFLAQGTPSGEPPFSLLDGVTVTQTTPAVTPEPSSILLLGTGVLSAAGFVRRRFVKA